MNLSYYGEKISNFNLKKNILGLFLKDANSYLNINHPWSIFFYRCEHDMEQVGIRKELKLSNMFHYNNAVMKSKKDDGITTFS